MVEFEKIAEQAFYDELEKISGIPTELMNDSDKKKYTKGALISTAGLAPVLGSLAVKGSSPASGLARLGLIAGGAGIGNIGAREIESSFANSIDSKGDVVSSSEFRRRFKDAAPEEYKKFKQGHLMHSLGNVGLIGGGAGSILSKTKRNKILFGIGSVASGAGATIPGAIKKYKALGEAIKKGKEQ